ncbi:MAG: MarR family winged helix-turn-helix transcriptional regulator [Sphingomonas bacterium]
MSGTEGLTEMERVALVLIAEAAEAGRQAPTADDIQERTGCNSISTTVNLVRRLELRGLIEVERFQRTRRITVVSTGKRTAAVSNETPHWRKGPRPRSVPAVPISYVQQRKAELAREMIVAARREGLSVQDFLGELVWAGWKARLRAMKEGQPSPLPFTSGERHQGRDGPQPSLNHSGGMIDPDASPHWAGMGSRSPPSLEFEEAGSPPPAQCQVNDAPHRSGQAGGLTDLALVNGRGEE